MRKHLTLWLIGVALCLQSPASAASFELPITGRITEKNGKPIDGPVELSISFFHSETDGAALLTVTDGLASVPLQEGIFQVVVGMSSADWQRVFPDASQPVFIEITDVSHENTTYPRIQVAMAPLAGKIPVDGKTIAFDSEGRAGLIVAGTQAAGKVLSSDGSGSLAWIDLPSITVAQVGGVAAESIAAGATAANQAASSASAGTIVKRDGAGSFSAGTVTADAVTLTAPSAASKPLTVKGAAGQSANLQEWLASSGSMLAGIGADGAIKLGSGSHSISLKAPSGMVSSTSYVLPAVPENGKFLMTDGSGNLTWMTPPTGGGTSNSAAGTAAAPGIAFTGDSDTGIWSSGADALSFSTAGSERARLDADGRLGVGTSAPAAQLDVRSSAPVALSGTVDVTAGTTAVTGTGTFFSSELAVFDAIRIGAQTLTVAAIADDTHLTLSAAHTAGATAATAFADEDLLRVKNAAGTTQLVVSKSGNVGIGSATPQQTLAVDGSIGILEGGTSPTHHSIFQGGDQAADISYTLPTAQGGNGSVLTNNGSGALSWSSVIVPASGTLATAAGSETLTNKTLGSTNTITGATAASFTNGGAVITLPTTSGTVATLTGIETLTNKTLTSPAVNTPTIAGGTLAGLTGLGIRDTSAAFDVTLAAASSTPLAAGRTLTVDVDNDSRTLALKKNLTIETGSITLAGQVGGSSVTLPAAGTLATLAGTETLTNKTISSPVFTGNVGIGTTGPVSKVQISSDGTGTWASDNGIGQLLISGATDSNKRLGLMIDTTNNVGVLQAALVGSGPYPLALNPAAGNVGIGTTSPSAKADVYNASSDTTLRIGGYWASGGAGISHLTFYNAAASSGTNALADIALQTGSTQNTGNLLFFTKRAASDSGATEAMRILDSGNVGIGTTAPGGLLDVGASSQFRIDSSGDVTKLKGIAYSWPSSQGGASTVLTNNGSGTLSWSAAGGGSSQWTTSGSNVYYNSGNIGIGTTSPTSTLHVQTGNVVGQSYTGIGGVGLNITSNDSAGAFFSNDINHSIFFRRGRDGVTNTSNYYQYGGTLAGGTGHRFYTGGLIENQTLKLQIADNGTYIAGNVGIGTTNPQAKLDMGGSGEQIRLSGDANQTYVTFYNGATRKGYIGTGVGGTNMIVNADGGNVVLQGGNVGIGTTNPTSKIDISNSTAGLQPMLSLNYPNAIGDGASIRWLSSSNTEIATLLSQRDGGGQYSLRFKNWDGAANTEHLTILYNGNVGIGTTSPSSTLTVNGAVRNASAILNGTSTINFATGNVQYSNADCGAFALHNVKDSGSYTLTIKGTTSATCSFTAYSDAGTTALTVHMPPDHAATTSAKHTMYHFLVVGADIYTSWTPGY